MQQAEITIDGGYRPDSIVALADVPLRLVLRRLDDDPCTERVIFSSPAIDRYLTPRSATTIVLPAQSPGQLRFTCGMGRYSGRIELVPRPPGEPLPVVAPAASAEDSPVGLGLMAWVCSLPIVGIVGLALGGPVLALVAALVSMPGWILGCRMATQLRRGGRAGRSWS